jgi:hypothetical protein
VTYLSSAPSITPYVQTTWRDVPALERFYTLGKFEALLRHHLVEIKPGACVVRPLQAAPEQTREVPASTVVLVTQNAPLRDLYDQLHEAFPALYLIGDAHSPRDVQAAIAEGHRVGRSLA